MNVGEGSGYLKKYVELTNVMEKSPVKKFCVTWDSHIV
jgi:hypothetical protein